MKLISGVKADIDRGDFQGSGDSRGADNNALAQSCQIRCHVMRRAKDTLLFFEVSPIVNFLLP